MTFSPQTEEMAQPSAPIELRVKPHSQKARNKTKTLLSEMSPLKGHSERRIVQTKPWKVKDWKKDQILK